MKTFGWVVLINIMIYIGYMLIMNALRVNIAAAAVILFHSVVLVAISLMFPRSEKNREFKQGLLTSGIIILLVGMPVCFFVTVGGF